MSKARLAVFAAVSILVAVGCSKKSSGGGSAATALALTAPAKVAMISCNAFTVALKTAAGAAATTTAVTTVTLTASRGTLLAATLADCRGGKAAATLAVPAGASSGTVYLSPGGTGAVTLTVAATGLTSAHATVTPELFLFGQPDASTVDQTVRNVGPGAISIGGGKLVASDLYRNRVLVWTTLPATATDFPALALGQPSLSTDVANFPSMSGSSLNFPQGVWTDGTKVVVADSNNNRVLVWSTFPTTTGQPASFALGVPAGAGNLTTAGSGATTASTFSPYAVHSDGTRLYVSDPNANRVLVWSTFPTTAGQAADFALGVPGGGGNLTTVGNGGCVAAELGPAYGITTLGSRLFLSDGNGYRVLAWSSIPTTGGQAANYVLGQPDPATCNSPPGTPSATTMSGPAGVGTDGTRLYVTDSTWNRTLVWNAAPTTNGQAPAFELGQPDFTGQAGNNPALSGSSALAPVGAVGDGTRLFLADSQNYRILVWHAVPTTNGQAADVAVGQPAGAGNLTGGSANPLAVSGSNVFFPEQVHSDGTRLFLVDDNNSRILVWNTFPTDPSQPADFALGQPAGAANLTSNVYGTTASLLQFATSVTTGGGKLFVADTNNNRVLGWNTIPTAGGQAADFVLGQPNFVSSSSNQGLANPTASTLSLPFDVYSDGTRLFVADSSNQRILVWSTLPSANGQAADLVLGQAGFTTANAATTASGMNSPRGVLAVGNRLYVADTGNNRVMAWNAIPTTNGQAADFALGQPAGGANLTSGTANNGGISASSLNTPYRVRSDGTRLAVADSNNQRVLAWTSLPTTAGQAADAVLGQANFTSRQANRGGAPSASSLYYPRNALVINGGVFVPDSNNQRLIAMPLP